MALGNSRPRNWGKEAQEGALRLACLRGKVAYQVRKDALFLAASANGLTLPFVESVAMLENDRRGHWVARNLFDDRVIATGVSQRDVIRATIDAVWH